MKATVYIVGSGPAGCAAAIALARTAPDLEVVLLTGVQRDGPAVGETLPPAATPVLQRLGLEQLLGDPPHLSCPGSISQWGSSQPGYNDFYFTPIGPGYHLQRERFDRDLLEAARRCGVEVLEQARLTAIKAEGTRWDLGLSVGADRLRRHADFVIDASGIQARVARSLGVVRNQYDCVISACAFFDLLRPATGPAHTLVSAVASGWWYATQLPGQQALLSVCVDAAVLKQQLLEQPARWHQAFGRADWFNHACAEQFGVSLCQPQTVHLRAAPSAILSCVVGERWLAVGDAASSHDSMTSAGITKALDQGQRAGVAVAEYLSGNGDTALQDYQTWVFDEFSHYLRLHQRLYAAETRFADQPFWQRRMLGRIEPRDRTEDAGTFPHAP